MKNLLNWRAFSREKALMILLWFSISLNAQDYKLAPNSYIFDVNLANQNNYGGINIPVKKAYLMWASYNYLKTNNASTPIPTGTQSASIYWEDVPGLISSVNIIAGATADASKIKVNIDKSKGKGNAVIAFKVNNTIYWSWHVWVTDDPTNGVVYNNYMAPQNINGNLVNSNGATPQMMDRNLGATSNTFLGNEWNKSGGLMYQFGRKDPFPPLVYTDASYYELDGEVGNIRHLYSKQISGYSSTIPVVTKTTLINNNIKNSVNNPFTLIKNASTTDLTPWYSNVNYVSGTTTHNLWGDNTNGANTSNWKIQIKSPLDPCPNGWKVPTFVNPNSSQNRFSPWGVNFVNGVSIGLTSYNLNDGIIKTTSSNSFFQNIKVYPALGIDFSSTNEIPNTNRGLGKYGMSGHYVLQQSGKFYHVDTSESANWSGTMGSQGQARGFHIINDVGRTDNNGIGKFEIYSHDLAPSGSAAQALRCWKDPNYQLNIPAKNITPYDFPTEYIPSEVVEYTKGLDYPNSYIVDTSTTQFIRIPINKAFSVYNQYLSNHEHLPTDNLTAKMLWSTEDRFIEEVSLELASDVRDSDILVYLKPGSHANAVVCLTRNDVILWSWHIWAPNGNPTEKTITYQTENTIPAANLVNATESAAPPLVTTFMDRDLGAVEKFPADLVFDPDNPDLINLALKSGGLHYQWGRKDPIPSFILPGNSGNYNLVLTNGTRVFKPELINLNQYLSDYVRTDIASGIHNQNLKKNEKLSAVINYTVQNPLALLTENSGRDWLSPIDGLGADRWGHATEKSVFDPCPSGWRVPDVSFVKTEESLKSTSTNIIPAKGFSPWSSSVDNMDQVNMYNVHDHDGYEIITRLTSNVLGWVFEYSGNYFNIGNFPALGIINYHGTKNSADSTISSGYWTSALAENMRGYSIAMIFHRDEMSTGSGLTENVYPQSALNVRCAKDEPRYLGIPVETLISKFSNKNFSNHENIENLENILNISPNPFTDKITISNSDEMRYKLYDMLGNLVLESKFINGTTSLSKINKGIYILVLENGTAKKMIKN